MQPLPLRLLRSSKQRLHSTVWPRSHKLIWNHTRKCMRDCEAYHPYQAEVLQEMKARTEPVETHGPAGTVVPTLRQTFLSLGPVTFAIKRYI